MNRRRRRKREQAPSHNRYSKFRARWEQRDGAITVSNSSPKVQFVRSRANLNPAGSIVGKAGFYECRAFHDTPGR